MSNILNSNYISERISNNFKQNIVLIHCFYKNNLIFITSDDKVFGLGSNDFGRLGFGDNIEVNSPKIIPELCDKGIQQFFIGKDFVLALNKDHHIYGWGCNDDGQLGNGHPSIINECLKAELISELIDKNIIEISCGDYHCLALTRDGVVYRWGANNFGQIGCGNRDNILKPRIIEISDNIKIKSIYCSNYCSFVITTDDKVYSWGHNGFFNLGHNERSQIITKPKLIDFKNVMKIRCSELFSYFLTNDGFIYFCGDEYKLIHQISNKLKFQSIEGYNGLICFKRNDIVYEFVGNTISKTDYKTFEDYYFHDHNVTLITMRVGTTEATMKTNITNDIKLKSSIDYKVIEKIGNGSFGEVYKVLDKCFSVHSAVKIVQKNDKIHKELEILKNIENDYCVKYIHSWIENDYYYIQMQLYKYNLKDIICMKGTYFKQHRDNPVLNAIDYYISCEIFSELLLGLHYLHSRYPPIIHRDLKPANVLVSETPENGIFCKISDFGLSIKKDPVTLTQTKGAGTYGYQAPEASKGKYYPKSDIFSLGMIVSDMFNMNEDLNQDQLKYYNNNYNQLDLISSQMTAAKVKPRPTAIETFDMKTEWMINKPVFCKGVFKLNLELMKTIRDLDIFPNIIQTKLKHI